MGPLPCRRRRPRREVRAPVHRRRVASARHERPGEPRVVEVRRERAPARVQVRLERRRIGVVGLAALAREEHDVVRHQLRLRRPQTGVAGAARRASSGSRRGRRRAAAAAAAALAAREDVHVAGARRRPRHTRSSASRCAASGTRACRRCPSTRRCPGCCRRCRPPARVPGRRATCRPAALSWHCVTLMVTLRRHFPICSTSGTLAPTGALSA